MGCMGITEVEGIKITVAGNILTGIRSSWTSLLRQEARRPAARLARDARQQSRHP